MRNVTIEGPKGNFILLAELVAFRTVPVGEHHVRQNNMMTGSRKMGYLHAMIAR
jgi:hypothetical protein